MVHTRHSYNKDLVVDTSLPNGHDNESDTCDEQKEDHVVRETDEPMMPREGNVSREEERAVPKPRKRRRTVLGLYENLEYTDTIQRRSLRNISRDRSRRSYHYEHPSSRRIKHSAAMRFQSFGSSLIRRSDRQPKKVFETFNESEIQRSIDRKHQEMLELEQASMYDSIKRRRGDVSDTQEEEDSEVGSEDDDGEGESEEEEEEEEGVEGEESTRAYSLRKTKPKTNIYQAPPLREGHRRKGVVYVESPMRTVRRMKRIPQHASSPHHRRYKRNRRRSSSTSSSDDEQAFERRKSKSMTQARARCLPMNFQPDDIVGVLKNRERAGAVGSSLADVDPMTIDSKISFTDVGGLDHHVRALKEMVVFPLLYPEVFQKFSIAPPRGVLFYGLPGTGKTLVARALANECSSGGQKVAFFMRKGADCLSKWVGESERQLRLLFDQAYSMRPSIIFFDEIDGIAPVRSTRQDQIHSSIVSTLLALMDGLDARGEIVVIGATNRLDAIDPALRRPGRFDREFLFTLPNRKARQKIVEIHTSAWQPKLSKEFTTELAEKCVGYCGADIKALCTETALFALRRRYPQIYDTNKKLLLDTNEIKVSAIDFKNAIKTITPASHRSTLSPGRSLPDDVGPLLQNYVQCGLDILHKMFPPGKPSKDDAQSQDDSQLHEEDSNSPNIFEKTRSRQRSHSVSEPAVIDFFTLRKQNIDKNMTHRPRLVVYGASGNGQTSYITPALLFSMEHLTTHVIDLPVLFGTSSRAPEEAVAQVFREARRTLPSIIYLPHIGVWWQSVPQTTRATFVTLLHDIPSSSPVLFLATAEDSWSDLPEAIQDLFSSINNELLEVNSPTFSERKAFFKDILLDHALRQPPREKRKCRVRVAEVLCEAPPPKPRELSTEECKRLQENEETTLRELRLFLRQITWKLLADRKFKEFSKPVDPEEVDDYYQVIKEPIDLSTIMTRINSHYYHSCAHFLQDIDLITNNCLEYNPDKDQFDKLLRNRACEMRDVAHALVYKDLDPEFEKLCIEINDSRKKRGFLDKENAPSFLKVMPKHMKTGINPPLDDTSTQNDTSLVKPLAPLPDPSGTRYSRRVRGLSEPFEIDTNMSNIFDGRRGPKKTAKQNTETLENNPSALSAVSDHLNDEQANSAAGTEITKTNSNIDKERSGKASNSPDVDMTCMTADTVNDTLNIKKDRGKDSPGKMVENVKRNLEFADSHVKTAEEGSNMVEAETLLNRLVDYTVGNSVQILERIYTNLCRCISNHRNQEDRSIVLKELKEIIETIK